MQMKGNVAGWSASLIRAEWQTVAQNTNEILNSEETILRPTTQQNSKIIKIFPFALYSGQDKFGTKISVGRSLYLGRPGK